MKEHAFLDDVNKFLPSDEDTVMQLYQKNQKRYIKQGVKKVVREMLGQGLSKQQVKSYTRLTDKEIEALNA